MNRNTTILRRIILPDIYEDCKLNSDIIISIDNFLQSSAWGTLSPIYVIFWTFCQERDGLHMPSTRRPAVDKDVGHPTARSVDGTSENLMPRRGSFNIENKSKSHDLIFGKYCECSKASHTTSAKMKITASINGSGHYHARYTVWIDYFVKGVVFSVENPDSSGAEGNGNSKLHCNSRLGQSSSEGNSWTVYRCWVAIDTRTNPVCLSEKDCRVCEVNTRTHADPHGTH